MSANEFVTLYCLRAAHCTEIAQRTSNTESRLALLAMAQSWRALAEQAVKNSETVLVHESEEDDLASNLAAVSRSRHSAGR